ncbi:HIT family protein [Natronobacterium gregoryi]|uniref:HIT domain-containing protein n=2 Tax=Natronobacterium gregoryi TaxID=44930 RepID=L0AGY3_NATGS|nr:HIT domain-containing protein [Natronobacterium gregoryi]AFZ72350.1 HIT family hydrolase, diadenosine tetraphosphate hydrolase [Natronobacterium gregoryi SP2]ELY64265.1 histidine triad (HIT) protein [Natronobacterium gregoryi SP2]PLK20335.1 HIT domain-containing protein [Natronobacterium gregoryi SP2]SFJ22770.1 ATP adenylyltransferase [Natronobacterium gregoryi]
MEQVFAPWRIEWIRRDEKNPAIDDCVFCELPELDDDRDNRLVARNDHAFVLLNNYPYNPGHVMVIPYAHTGEYADLTDQQLLGHAQLKQRTFDALEKAIDPDGFNAGLNLGDGAGGSIGDHLHTHVVPRWQGDTNFMPVLSDTTVVVEALEETYDHLYEAFANQEGATVPDDESAVVFE